MVLCPIWLALQNKAALEKFETDLLAVIGEQAHSQLSGCVLTVLAPPPVTCGVSVPSYERWNIVCFLLHELPEAVAVQTELVRCGAAVRCGVTICGATPSTV